MPPKILIVSPVRNEAAHIERVAAAVAGQERRPQRWLIVDDGSSDGTRERLKQLTQDLRFASVIDAPHDASLDATRDRLARAAEIRSFNAALAAIDVHHYTHVMKLDGDIELPPEYLRTMCERFAANSRLGIAGGVLVEPDHRGAMRPVMIPSHHVHGALKLYSRECLAAIGGIPRRLGWDTIDETYARMRGFETVTFADLVSIHHRPVASADGRLRGRARHGECAYIVHYPPPWVAARAVKVARNRPPGLSGGAFLFGYASAALRRVERVADEEYRRFTRRELRARIAGSVAGALKATRGFRSAHTEQEEAPHMPTKLVHAGGPELETSSLRPAAATAPEAYGG
jgi:poly-beta-1,6-N-acetyl-D-glucosamine synthase